MKQFTLMLVALMVTSLTFAQQSSERIVLIEEFTQASCGPCAGFNPGFDVMLDDHAEKVVVVKYQTSWPGFDPMHNLNPSDVNNRVSVYGVDGVPSAVVNGNVAATNVAAIESSINTLYGESTPFIIDAVSVMAEDNSTLSIDVNVIANEAVSGNLKAHIAIVEKNIEFGSAPGSNGETEFHHVMKKMMPDADGTSLEDFAAGESFSFSETWEIPETNLYDYSTVGVVVWIQDASTREVYQATFSHPDFFSEFTANAGIAKVEGVEDAYCLGNEVEPKITIRNFGNDPLTSLSVYYTINGSTTESFEWTGNIPTFAEERITIPSLDIEFEASNTIDFTLSSPNGLVDEDNTNDNVTVTFNRAPESGTQLNLELTTDTYGYETYWEVRNESGAVVESGGVLGAAGAGAGTYGNSTTYNEEITLTGSGCHTFYINDAFGDGICCGYGNGGYILTDASGSVIVSGGQFTQEEFRPFSATACEAPMVSVENSPDMDEEGNGTATATANSGQGPFTFSWSNGFEEVTSGVSTLTGLSSGVYQVTISDASGCEITEWTIVGSVLGIDDVTGAYAAIGKTYPNPANELATIEVSGIKAGMKLEVVDIAGKVILVQALEAGAIKAEINTSNLAEGSYLFRLTDNNRTLNTQKLVVVH